MSALRGEKPVMKRSAVFWLALLGMAAIANQSVQAGSAVATDGQGHLVYCYGYPKEIATQRALELAHSRYGPDVRLIAASDVPGYGAIAVGRKGSGTVNGISLGRPSPLDAENRAVELCLN
jgi:hypothetical protein